jgi:hypothetical protein
MLDWGPYDGWPHRPTEAGVRSLNAAIEAVAAEFGPQVITVETASVMRAEEAMFASAGTYPNDAGHAALARACAAALSAAEIAERPLHAEAERRPSGGLAQRG